MEWRDIKKKTWITEICVFIVMAIVIIIGIYEEYIAQCKVPKCYVSNFDTVSLSVIAVQATVSTLVITILSLIANKINDQYLGVFFNEFMLDIKPCVLKQKVIIIIEIILIIGNFFVHMMRWYNVVIAVFIVALLLVVVSVLEIYNDFLGSERINDEIIAYLNSFFDSYSNSNEASTNNQIKHSSKLKLEKCRENENEICKKYISLCDQWKNTIAAQSEPDYKLYWNFFQKMFSYMLSSDDDKNILFSKCTDLSYTLLASSVENNNLRGISLIQNIYSEVWEPIRKNNTKGYDPDKFGLFSKEYEDIIGVLPTLNIDKLEKVLRWAEYCKIIIQVNLWLKNDTDTDVSYLPDDILAVENFCYRLGLFISLDTRVQTIDMDLWGSQLYSFAINRYSVPSDLKQLEDRIYADCCFNFMISQVRNGYYELIKTYWYKNLETYFNLNVSDDVIYITIKLHCYIYYLAYNEKEYYISENIIKMAKRFIEDEFVIKCFENFITTVAEYDKNVLSFTTIVNKSYDIFNSKLVDRLYADLKSYEFMPSDYQVKRMIMEDVIQDFVIFLSCYIENDFGTKKILDSIITKEDASSYYIRFVQKDRSSDVLRFFYIMKHIDASATVPTDDNESNTSRQIHVIEEKARLAYLDLVNVIEDKYKDYSIYEAKSNKKYTNAEYSQQKEKAENYVITYLKNHFSDLISDDISEENVGNIFKKNGYSKYVVFRALIFTDMDVEKYVKDFANQIFIMVSGTIINKLNNAGILEHGHNSNDDDWINFLNSNRDMVAIGSEYALYPKDYRKKEKIREWLDSKSLDKYLFKFFGDSALINKGSLKLDFRNADLEIKSETLNEAIDNKEAVRNESNGKYRYAPSNGMPADFTKEELEQYLKNRRIVVTLSLEIGVEVNDSDTEYIGYYINRS